MTLATLRKFSQHTRFKIQNSKIELGHFIHNLMYCTYNQWHLIKTSDGDVSLIADSHCVEII